MTKFPQMTGQDKRLDYNMISVNTQLVKQRGSFTVFWYFLAWYAVLGHPGNSFDDQKIFSENLVSQPICTFFKEILGTLGFHKNVPPKSEPN